MCSKKPKVKTVIVTQAAPAAAPPPVYAASVAAPVDAPSETSISNLQSEGQQRQRRAKGKKRLTIPTASGVGTGVNL